MSLESLEFTIYPDGRVVETVKGVKGEQCAALTQELEEKLGHVTHRQDTDERYHSQTDEQTQQQRQWENWNDG